MKRKLLRILLTFITLFSLPLLSAAEDIIPEIKKPVNDYAGILTPAEEKKITGMLVAHREKTGVQIAVLTVRSTAPLSIEEFSIKTAEKWGGGSKERDDGLLFAVAVYDRRMRIEVGYGLEWYVTDLKAGRILDGIRAEFRNFKYGQGIERAVSQIIQATDEVRPGQEPSAFIKMRGAVSYFSQSYILLFITGSLIGFIFYTLRAKKKLINKKKKMKRHKTSVLATITGSLIIFAAIPALLQLFMPGVWYWTPLSYITGAIAGTGLVSSIIKEEIKTFKIIATVFTAIPAIASFAAIFYSLHVLKPVQSGTSEHETACMIILMITNFLQITFLFVFGSDAPADGSLYSSTGYSSSGSSYSSSSSENSSSSDSSTSWSGGGGSFGGGGASSSW